MFSTYIALQNLALGSPKRSESSTISLCGLRPMMYLVLGLYRSIRGMSRVELIGVSDAYNSG